MTATLVSTSTPVTDAIVRFAASADFRDAPDELFDRVTRAFIDTVGVAIAARNDPSFLILARTLQSQYEVGDATVVPTRARASAPQAAFLNGTAGHALDYDDVADQIKGHPSVVLVSTLLPLAESAGSTGRELLEAYIVGFEVACAIAGSLPVAAHYSRGWHSTATVGILGATVGAARLLRLDEPATRHALGIAVSMAGGSRQNFGTMTKPLHAGLASRDAVMAVQLAANGFTADPDHLDAPLGFFRLYGADPQPQAIVDELQHPNILLEHGLNVKKYPCCYGTHRMADAALALLDRGLGANDVRSITVAVEPAGQQAIIHHRPQTGLQGKFSGEYVVAACFLDGGVRLSTFTDQAVARADAQDLLRRVTIEELPVPPFGGREYEHAYATLEVTCGDGSVIRQRCDIPRGDARLPLSDAELEAKFRDCLAFADSPWDADTLLSTLRALRSSPRVRLS